MLKLLGRTTFSFTITATEQKKKGLQQDTLAGGTSVFDICSDAIYSASTFLHTKSWERFGEPLVGRSS